MDDLSNLILSTKRRALQAGTCLALVLLVVFVSLSIGCDTQKDMPGQPQVSDATTSRQAVVANNPAATAQTLAPKVVLSPAPSNTPEKSFADEVNKLNDPSWKPTAGDFTHETVTSAATEVGRLVEESHPAASSPESTPHATENDTEPLLTTEEVEKLNRSASDPSSSSDGGGPGSASRVFSSGGGEVSDPVELVEESPEDALPYVDGQARGYAILTLMQPEARRSVSGQLSALYRSKVKNIVISVLIDGTFSWDPGYFRNVLRALNQGERRLTLVLYISNGPTMRRYKVTPIRTAFSTMQPELFREKIRYDPQVRAEFKSLAERAEEMFAFNRALNARNRNVAVVMLEDNLDYPSYRAAREIARSAVSSDVFFVRNPCPGCWPGNDMDPQGDGLEFHNAQEMARFGGTGFSLDGVGFRHDFESGLGLKIDAVKALMKSSVDRGVDYFEIWRHDRQGVPAGLDLVPGRRNYAVPTEQQIKAEIELLRDGLKAN